MFEFNPLCYKKKPYKKYYLIFFFCNFIIDSFSLWRCSTEGAAQVHSDPSQTSEIVLLVKIVQRPPIVSYFNKKLWLA